MCKIRFKEFAIKFGVQKARGRKDNLEILEAKLNILDSKLEKETTNMELIRERSSLKGEYDKLYVWTLVAGRKLELMPNGMKKENAALHIF